MTNPSTLRTRLFFGFCVAALGLLGIQGTANSQDLQVEYTELRDSIPIRGTDYLIRFPENWNGTLISDLDYRRAADSPLYLHLLNQGYALSGMQRRPERLTEYDPAHEIHDLVTVMDIFESNFGKPSRTIQYGCSGGANVTVGMAEIHPDRIDGAVATGSVTSPWFTNQHLDGFFVLKALIAPELPIVNLPIVDPEITEIGDAWREAIEAAQQTPEGRARIALAVTIGQWPAWANIVETTPVPEPDPSDVHALQIAMYHGVSAVLPSNVTFGHSMLEQVAGLLRWNTGVDYKEFFANGDVFYKQAVATLYDEAGLNLEEDLERINGFPRIEAEPSAVKYWSSPGRTHVGEPKVPLLRMHNNGDLLVYPSMLKGYQALVDANGRTELYRSAFTNRAGHCTYSLSESLAAIKTLIQRLDLGVWPSTDPEVMNALAASLDPTSTPKFYYYRGVTKYNRVWLPSATEFIGNANP
ncbi:MAG: hypothetical protein P8J61_06370 [Gammaproteobacteria bacterium]|nr:hypothetical protein [Gammaproteobacteria bacterium]